MFSYSFSCEPEVFTIRSGCVGHGVEGARKSDGVVGKREGKFPDNRPFNLLGRIGGRVNETGSTGARGQVRITFV